MHKIDCEVIFQLVNVFKMEMEESKQELPIREISKEIIINLFSSFTDNDTNLSIKKIKIKK